MISLRQLLSRSAPLLVLDAASSRIQVGWLASPGAAKWAASEDEAGVGLFRAIEELGIDVGEAASFAYAQSPGSVLGIRLSAIAIRTWTEFRARPVFSYDALALVARAAALPDITYIADARRGEWHCHRLGRGGWRQGPEGLEPPLATPAGFRHWSPLPPATQEVPYRLDRLLEKTIESDLLAETSQPDADLPETRYATWSRRVHRGIEKAGGI